MCRQAPDISYLLFADDNLLFFKGSIDQALLTKKILACCDEGVGKLLSPSKRSTMFGKNYSLKNQVSTMVILQVTDDGLMDMYVGLPVLERRMRADKFQPAKDKFLKRLSNWTNARNMLIVVQRKPLLNQ